MTSDTRTAALTPEELELLAGHRDGVLSSDEIRQAEGLLARSEVAREVLAEASELLEEEAADLDDEVPDPSTTSVDPRPERASGLEETEAPAPPPPIPSPRMGWRTFLPLAAAGVAVIFLLWPGRESLNLVSWTETLAARRADDLFAFPVLRGEIPAGEPSEEDVAEAAGIRWVDLRVALRAGRRTEADSLARVLAASLDGTLGSGAVRGRVEALVGRDPDPEELETIQEALFELFGAAFEDAAVLETLRRAAGARAASLAADLVEHPSLNDRLGDDLDPQTRAELLALCEGGLTVEELAEMEAIVTEVLRRRT